MKVIKLSWELGAESEAKVHKAASYYTFANCIVQCGG